MDTCLVCNELHSGTKENIAVGFLSGSKILHIQNLLSCMLVSVHGAFSIVQKIGNLRRYILITNQRGLKLLYFIFCFQKRAQTHTSSIAREMATVLDTSLLQALILTGQSSGAMELLKGLNYCDLKICEEFLKEWSDYMVLLELYKSNEMHREALQLLNQLVEKSKSEMENTDFNKKFNPHMIIEYLRVQFIFPLLVFN